MRLLLDTHTLIWWWAHEGRQLPERIRDLIADPDNMVFVSAATAWEMATKVRSGKLAEALSAVENFSDWLDRDSFVPLAVSHEHALLSGGLDIAHRDPFDRMLAAQSIIEEMALVSRDAQLDAFGCERIWA